MQNPMLGQLLAQMSGQQQRRPRPQQPMQGGMMGALQNQIMGMQPKRQRPMQRPMTMQQHIAQMLMGNR